MFSGRDPGREPYMGAIGLYYEDVASLLEDSSIDSEYTPPSAEEPAEPWGARMVVYELQREESAEAAFFGALHQLGQGSENVPPLVPSGMTPTPSTSSPDTPENSIFIEDEFVATDGRRQRSHTGSLVTRLPRRPFPRTGHDDVPPEAGHSDSPVQTPIWDSTNPGEFGQILSSIDRMAVYHPTQFPSAASRTSDSRFLVENTTPVFMADTGPEPRESLEYTEYTEQPAVSRVSRVSRTVLRRSRPLTTPPITQEELDLLVLRRELDRMRQALESELMPHRNELPEAPRPRRNTSITDGTAQDIQSFASTSLADEHPQIFSNTLQTVRDPDPTDAPPTLSMTHLSPANYMIHSHLRSPEDIDILVSYLSP